MPEEAKSYDDTDPLYPVQIVRFLRAPRVGLSPEPHMSLGLDVYNEKYDTADWYVDGIGPADISGLLNLGESSPDYSVNVIRVLARFRL